MSDLIIKPSGTSANFKVQNPSGTDKIVMNSSGTITTATLGSGVDLGLTANHSGVKTALNASGDAPIYACRAWVNFNGTTGSGTGQSDITIRDSGNVSSITDNGTGLYTVNFTTAMPDTNYSVVCAGSRDDTSSTGACIVSARSGTSGYSPYSTGSVALSCLYAHTSAVDADFINAAIFR